MTSTDRQRKFSRGYIHWILIGGLALVVVIAISLIIHWQPERVVKRQQASLFRAVETKKPARIRRLLSNKYEDSWGFTAQEASDAFLEARSHFLALGIEIENQSIAIEGKRATVTIDVKLVGTSLGPVGAEVIRVVNRLEDPFTFVWEKETFLPSSWKLVEAANDGIPLEAWRSGSIPSF